jgi:hypothetical protein
LARMHEAGSFVDCCWFDDYIISPEPAFLFAISIGYSLSKCHSGLTPFLLSTIICYAQN